jgi:hypothetical protein
MSTMPVIDNDMIDLFRRMGKRRGTYRATTAATQRVTLQRSKQCRFVGQRCFGSHGELAICDQNLDCIIDPFPGGDPHRL